jgi:Ca2+-binding EF-hand superfamily protein
MKKNAALFGLLCATLLSISSTSFAEDKQSEQPGPPPSFEQLDTNGDGQLSKDEVKGPLQNDFDRFDANGDGMLSQDELPAPPPAPEKK